MKARNQIAACLAGIMSLVVMPALALAQPGRTYTAPSQDSYAKKDSKEKLALNTISDYHKRSDIMPPIEITKVQAGNPENLEPGFYAAFKPKTYDTVFIYEGATEEFVVVGVQAGKEIIHGDSLSVATDVSFRMNHINEEGIPVESEKKAKTNSMVIRSGAIPAQGFGSQRYRFAVKPSSFALSESSMISASVHMNEENNIGNVLCAVTSIDYKKGIFYVEASNEIPKGECINWIIVNTQ
jgi:hypothetical protein